MNYKYVDLKIGEDKPIEDPQTPRNILEPNMVKLIVGKMGQGKSTYLSNIIKNDDLLGKKYHQILFFTPNEIPGIKRNQDFSSDLDINWINDKLTATNEICKKGNINGNILIVFDDMVTQIFDERNNSDFQKLILNRRHQYSNLCISFIFTTQYLKLFPKKYRHVLNYIVCFPLDASEMECIAKDYIFDKKKKDTIMMTMQQHFKANKHNFILLDLYDHVYFLNFSKAYHL